MGCCRDSLQEGVRFARKTAYSTVSGICNGMKLRSALDDLASTTLRAMSGLWEKLQYFAGLRSTGNYHHWGLSRIYGKVKAQQALKDAHQQVLKEVLRKPVRDLQQDLRQASECQGLKPAAYLEKLKESGPDLLPEDPGPAAERHFSSVLFALSALEQHQGDAIPQDALPSPPPAPRPPRPAGVSKPSRVPEKVDEAAE